MSNGFSDQMEQEYLDELLMQDAARLIDMELLEDAKQAQAADVDSDWLRRLENTSVKQIQKKRRKQTLTWRARKIGRIAAIFVITISLIFSTVYVSVGAAREAINNFFTGKTNRRATVVYPVPVEGQTYSLIPEGWRGPLYATWMPDGYMHANSGTQSDQHWWLCYSHKDNILKSICIYAWDNTFKPKIDVENYELLNEQMIQDVKAEIYLAPDNSYSLVMAKNDLVIQIIGDISEEEIIQIAECLEF